MEQQKIRVTSYRPDGVRFRSNVVKADEAHLYIDHEDTVRAILADGNRLAWKEFALPGGRLEIEAI